jgi:cell wall-associated NlpC family hydrolase
MKASFISRLFSLCFVAFCALALQVAPLSAGQPASRAPQAPQTLDALIGLPYRADGALDSSGRYTLFEKPTLFFDTPGLNCSGFVLAAARILLGVNVTLDQAARDRAGNSGPQSPLGEDWDYGYDLIGNITEGWQRFVLLPDAMLGPTPDPLDTADGRSLRGFALHDEAAWDKVLAKLKPGWIYFASWSRQAKRPEGRRLLHYHVSLLLKDQSGRVWMHQSTPKAGVHSLELSSKSGRQRLRNGYLPGDEEAQILIVGVKAPR